jgi:7-cyano-7-deazaguanine synthase in queuosine biosynthesis
MNIISLQALGDTIEIPIPETYEKIGIAMSGGMDSTLLASILFEHLDDSKVTVYTVDLRDSKEFVKNILAKLGVNPKIEIVPDPKNTNGALSPQFQKIMEQVDYFYTGTNQNPRWADAIENGKKPFRYVKTQWKNMLTPFGVSYKSHIVDLYFTLGKTDLLPYTHTCTQRAQSSCGVCFACAERKWAFESIERQDIVEYEDESTAYNVE